MQCGGAGYVVSPVLYREAQKSGSRPRLLAGFAFAALFVVAFAVRLMGVTLFITPDEDNWMRRTGNFAQAMGEREYRRTFQSGHPGVTTMWVAWIGAGPDVARLAGVTVQDHPVTREPGFMDFLIRARIAMIAVNSVLLLVIVGLASRLVGLWAALLGGGIQALDPFYVAHTQVVHVDGLSAGLMTVCMLAAGSYWWAGGGRGYLVLCGVSAGLREPVRRVAGASAFAAVMVGHALPLAMVAPYPLAYYNPLLGGGPAAVRILLVGWGEGLDQVAAYLNAQPHPEQQLVTVYFPLELNFQGMVAGTVTQFGDDRPVNYVVDYVNAAQREQTPSETVGSQPVYEVWINGIEYARVFHLDPPRPVRRP
jgi:hypothetical protein